MPLYKGKLPNTLHHRFRTKPGESPADASQMEAAGSSNLVEGSPTNAMADRLSGAIADPGDRLQEPHASPRETGSS